MIPPAAAEQIPSELDVRELRKPDKHPTERDGHEDRCDNRQGSLNRNAR